MKKIFLIFNLLSLLSANAYADVCFYVSDKVAANAADIIRAQNEIYDYCSICPDAEPKTILVKDVTNSVPLKVNSQPIDLAHTYYKDGNKYVNLAIKAGCIKEGEYDILSELDSLAKIHHSIENDRASAATQAQKIFDRCAASFEDMKVQTTFDMLSKNTKINDCLENAIGDEIKKGFAPEYQEKMKNYIKQLRKMTYNFYYDIYAENKYCDGSCGTITALLPYADESNMLEKILERLLFINITKNRY